MSNYKPVWGYRVFEKFLGPRFFMGLYPPLLVAGIGVKYVAPDFREIRVVLKSGFLRYNYVGTHFGGSLYTMTDPFYMLMLYKNLGPEYIVWDTAANIRFIKAVREPVYATFILDEKTLDKIRSRAETGEKVIESFEVPIRTRSGQPVASVTKELYIRKKGSGIRGNP